jgi:hypothetical protein
MSLALSTRLDVKKEELSSVIPVAVWLPIRDREKAKCGCCELAS